MRMIDDWRRHFFFDDLIFIAMSKLDKEWKTKGLFLNIKSYIGSYLFSKSALFWNSYICLLFLYRDYIEKKIHIIGPHCACRLIFYEDVLIFEANYTRCQNVLIKYKTTGTMRMRPNDVNFFADIVPIKKQQTYIYMPK